MSEADAKIRELFRDTLLSDEEIYWLGAPRFNFWHLRGRYVFYIVVFLMLVPLLVIAFKGLLLGVSMARWLIGMMSFEFAVLLAYYIIMLLLGYMRKAAQERKHSDAEPADYHKAFYWWKPSYYAITNRRVLIFEQGSIRDYWYQLLDMPILKKPKNRVASIQLYSSTYAAKKRQTPVLDTLRGIPEDEADDVFAILKQSREEALDERARKNGME